MKFPLIIKQNIQNSSLLSSKLRAIKIQNLKDHNQGGLDIISLSASVSKKYRNDSFEALLKLQHVGVLGAKFTFMSVSQAWNALQI